MIFLIFSEDTILNFSIRAFKWCIAQIKIRETRFLVAILRRYPVLDLRAYASVQSHIPSPGPVEPKPPCPGTPAGTPGGSRGPKRVPVTPLYYNSQRELDL